MSTTSTNSGGGADPRREMEDDAARARERLERERASAERVGAEARESVREAADEAAHEARRRAREMGEEGKGFAAEGMRDFSEAISAAGRTLSERDQGLAASFASQAADGLASIARSVEGRSPEDLMRSTTAFARRNPAAFLAGATLLGVALGRFATATEERHASTGTVPTGRGAEAPSAPAAAAGGPVSAATPASPERGAASPNYRPTGPAGAA